MKNTFLFVLMTVSIYCHAQEPGNIGEKVIIDKVNRFFDTLESQDTTLFESLALPDAGIWTVRRGQDSIQIRGRKYSEDTKHFNPKQIIYERALDMDIKTHHDIAVAWVPYERHINQVFSHCGVDVFTFLNTIEGWKIANLSYSIEPDGSASI